MNQAFKHPSFQKTQKTSSRQAQQERYKKVRQKTVELCQPLEPEDFIIQSMEEVSPPKWHLAHTAWFFETFILRQAIKDYKVFHPQFNYLFNSYYKGIGAHHPRPQRGLLARPTIEEVYAYRQYVDEAMLELFCEEETWNQYSTLITLGLHHEQQHQELLLTDIKYNFYCNPLRPAYQKRLSPALSPKERGSHHSQNLPSLQLSKDSKWQTFHEGLTEIGFSGNGFCFDNELPPHRIFLQAYKIAKQLVTNGEYLQFIQAGGYDNAKFWLSDGWNQVLTEKWKAPLYWEKRDSEWWQFTLEGIKPLDLAAPVCHLSFYEADAFARWHGQRLPSEAEWEHAAKTLHSMNEGNFFQTVWQWTQSPYSPYPGFKPASGTIGEYNGKFMCNQMVLRGSSTLTSPGHSRISYRNFFSPQSRWQCSGIRLAKDA